jgi:small subunit ribosomal protein S17
MSENTTQATTADKAKRGQPKSRIGVVLSNKMQKTVVVKVERRTKHGKYGKVMTEKNNYKAHDEENSAKIGDTVRIVETRPMSKDKRWRVAEILVRADQEVAKSERRAAAKAEGQ